MNELFKALTSEDETDRLYAAHDLASAGDASASLPLLACLERELSQVVKDALVFALKSIPCTEAFEKLFALFSSPEAYLRNQAVAIFGAAGKDAVPYLASHRDHTNREVRKLILDALFEIGSRDAVLAIRAYIHDDAQNVKIAAVEYLGRLNDSESVPELIELFKDASEPMLRSSILDALVIIGNTAALETVKELLQSSVTGAPSAVPADLPHRINLVCRCGDRDEIVDALQKAGDNPIFADDIIAGLLLALRRYSDILLDATMCTLAINLLMSEEAGEDARLKIAELIGNKIYPNALGAENIFAAGNDLVDISALTIGGLTLLKACGTDEAFGRIRQVLDGTDNTELKALYEDLLSGALPAIRSAGRPDLSVAAQG